MIENAEAENRAADLKAQTTVKNAEAERQAQILKAQGEAEAKKIIAEAEACFTLSIAKALEKADAGYSVAKYLIALNYIHTMREMSRENTNKIVYLPYETLKMLDRTIDE